VVRDASRLPRWSSFLLSLGFDVAVRMQHAGNLTVPAQPNVLQLFRATTQPGWPATNLDGQPLPAPTLYGEAQTADSRRGSRVFIRDQYRHIFDECALARREYTTEFGGAFNSQGAIILGNSGTGKS
jgi:hypothetical protein